MSNVHELDKYSRANEEARHATAGQAFKGPPGNGTYDGMSDRISKLEGQQEGIKHGQAILFAAVSAVSAILIGVGIYTATRLDALSDKVNNLPSQISSEIRETNRAFSEALSAAKIQPPTVIYMDRAQPPQSQQAPTK